MRRLPPLSALRAFEAAGRHMSFKGAAAELGVTPTAISHQVKLLEHFCGETLFRRRPRPMTMTDAGRRLLPPVRDAFDQLSAASTMFQTQGEKRLLRITTTNAFASRWLVPRLPLWRQAHPRIGIEVIGTDALVDLNAGQADLAIRYAFAPPPGFVTRELCRDRFWPVCSPALLASGPRIRRPEDLARYPLINVHWYPWEANAPLWPRWFAAAGVPAAKQRTLSQPGGLTFSEELHAIQAVVAGQGIAICSDILVAREMMDGSLVRAYDVSLPGFGFYLTSVADSPRRGDVGLFGAWAASVI
ncbi:MAG: LysR substrate-binding domain-containing protein [Acetobacteraceae bacterium]|nr:LysR family transcriptional regulator [Pseudomonadota bacterium]